MHKNTYEIVRKLWKFSDGKYYEAVEDGACAGCPDECLYVVKTCHVERAQEIFRKETEDFIIAEGGKQVNVRITYVEEE